MLAPDPDPAGVDAGSGPFVAAPTLACNATVAYAFLTQDELPLWPVWESYFAGCPEGSYTVLVHTQKPNSTLANVSSVGGEELPPEEIVQGDLRYNYSMVDAMLALYAGVASRGLAPNGCTPAWVHMASYSCVPVAPCSEVHDHLEAHAGKSFLNHWYDRNAWKTSQWMTLWSEHAFGLARDREKLRARWSGAQDGQMVHINGTKHKGALDELVWPAALDARGYRAHRRSLVYVDWGNLNLSEPTTDAQLAAGPLAVHGAAYRPPWKPTPNKTFHLEADPNLHGPRTFNTADEAAEAIAAARADDRLFARKFVGTPDVIDALLPALQIRD